MEHYVRSNSTEHLSSHRQVRTNFIDRMIGWGDRVAKFSWDKGHPDGPEVHFITSTGIIEIYNKNTERHITDLIARPGQINRYYKAVGKEAPTEIMRLAEEHTRLGYNHI